MSDGAPAGWTRVHGRLRATLRDAQGRVIEAWDVAPIEECVSEDVLYIDAGGVAHLPDPVPRWWPK